MVKHAVHGCLCEHTISLGEKFQSFQTVIWLESGFWTFLGVQITDLRGPSGPQEGAKKRNSSRDRRGLAKAAAGASLASARRKSGPAATGGALLGSWPNPVAMISWSRKIYQHTRVYVFLTCKIWYVVSVLCIYYTWYACMFFKCNYVIERNPVDVQ